MKGKRGNIPENLTLWEKLSYGGGDIANCITFGMVSSYLSYYYTDIAGIPLVAVGVILGVTRLIEALANFLTGVAIDRTDSRFGRTKPFLYFTIVPLMVMFVLVFAVPEGGATGKMAFAFVTYLLFCILYAVNNTGFGTMMSVMTPDMKERRSLNNFKVFGCGLGNLVVSFCTLPLIALLGVTGHFSYTPTALIYGIVSLFLLGNCAIACKERVVPDKETRMGLRESFRCASKSRAWILLCAVSGMVYMLNVMRTQSMMYYAEYVLGNASFATVLLTVCTVASLVTSPFMDKLLNRIGSWNCLILGYAVFIVSSAGLFFSEGNRAVLVVLVFLGGVGTNLANGPSYAICADTVDEVERLTGKRPQGIMTSFMMCIMKAGIAAAGVVFTLVLNIGGYSADAAVQSGRALMAIRCNLIVVPAALAVIALILCIFLGKGKSDKGLRN